MMQQMINTLAQLQRLRDKAVKDVTVQLAKQQQVCAGYENNIKALDYLIQKTSTGVDVPSVESLKNVTGYKGTLRTVIAWQEQEKTLAKIKESRIQKNLVSAACDEKIVAMVLDEKRHALHDETQVKEQKAVDEIAAQCWLRQKIQGLV